MKKIFFAMVVLAALASCQKAEIAEQNSVNTNGERVITAYFDNAQTKTTLDGVTPKWTAGDKIMLLDETSKDEITLADGNIAADGKSVTFTTTLTGTLYAVYPSTATSAEKIETGNIVPVTLKAEQDGTFGSANICVAKDNDGSLAFKNVTSVLHLTQEDATNVNEIILTTGSATAYIAGTGTVDMSATTPALTLSSDQSNKIKVKSASAESHYYIAVVPTTLPKGTAFGFATGSKLGGTNLSGAKTIAANTIYNIGSMDADDIDPNTYHDYVEINGLKWATMNIGATSPTDYGYYFFWGGTEGYKHDGSKWVKASDNTTELSGGFIQANDQHYNGSAYTKYTTGTGGDGKTTLDLVDDAANANWGGTWRMPKAVEFNALKSLKKGDFVLGYHFGGDTEAAQIFLPVAGYGNGTGLSGVSEGDYWSSSLVSGSSRYLSIKNGTVSVTAAVRYQGFSVRALSE